MHQEVRATVENTYCFVNFSSVVTLRSQQRDLICGEGGFKRLHNTFKAHVKRQLFAGFTLNFTPAAICFSNSRLSPMPCTEVVSGVSICLSQPNKGSRSEGLCTAKPTAQPDRNRLFQRATGGKKRNDGSYCYE